MKRFIVVLLCLVLLNSCESEVKSISFETISTENNYDAQITANFDKATGKTDLSQKINSNINASIIASLSENPNETDLNTILEQFNTEYVDFIKDFPEDAEPKWELHIETEKTYQSENVISIAINTYEFQGGAHGNDKITFLNLNAKTGDVLSRNDMIDNLEDFKTLAETYFVKSLKNEDHNVTMEDFFFGKPFQLPENIGYSEDGLILLYNVYEVASYAQGYTEIAIPFVAIEDYLKLL